MIVSLSDHKAQLDWQVWMKDRIQGSAAFKFSSKRIKEDPLEMSHNQISSAPSPLLHTHTPTHRSTVKGFFQTSQGGTSLVAQWLGGHLAVQGTQFDPWSGKLPYASIPEPTWPRAHALNKRPLWRAVHTPQPLRISTRGSPHRDADPEQPVNV